jgi:hypothetical protein
MDQSKIHRSDDQSDPKQANTASENIKPKPKTFAQALTHLCDIPSSQLPQAVLKGDNFAISISEEEYEAGMDACKHNLHARII